MIDWTKINTLREMTSSGHLGLLDLLNAVDELRQNLLMCQDERNFLRRIVEEKLGKTTIDRELNSYRRKIKCSQKNQK